MDYIYLIIPTINGEINGDAIVSLSIDYDFPEVTIYKIDLNTMEVIEIC